MKKFGKKQYLLYRHGHAIYGISLLMSGVVVILSLPMDMAMPLNMALFGFGLTGMLRWDKDCRKTTDRITREGQGAQRQGLPVTSNPYSIDSEEYFHAFWDAGWKYQSHLCKSLKRRKTDMWKTPLSMKRNN